MKIYTRKGDDGTTGLLFGGRVRKDDARIIANGDVDETQALLGVVRSEVMPGSALAELLLRIERDLWVLMAELAVDSADRQKVVPGKTAITPQMVADLEREIDSRTANFAMPAEFVLPGEGRVSARLDHVRAVARRAERSSIAVAESDSLVVPYLNRLSDLLWIVARREDVEFRTARNT